MTERGGVERLDAGRYSTKDHPRCAIALGQGVGALFRLGKCPAPTKKAGVPPDLKRTRRVHAEVAVGGRILRDASPSVPSASATKRMWTSRRMVVRVRQLIMFYVGERNTTWVPRSVCELYRSRFSFLAYRRHYSLVKHSLAIDSESIVNGKQIVSFF